MTKVFGTPTHHSLKSALLLALCAIFAVPSASFAGTTTSSYTVTAVNSNTCAISGLSGPATMSINATTGASASGQFYVTCTTGDAYNVEMNPGLYGSDGASPIRYLNSGGNRIQYYLWMNSNDTGAWGDTPGTNTNALTGNGGAQGIGMWFTINAPGYTVPAGTYTDTITITIAY